MSDFQVPLVGFGTYDINGDQVEPALDKALTVGYRFFDTAKVYGNEKEIGDALEKLLSKHKLSREDVRIATKVYPEVASESEQENVRNAVEESLKLLKTSYIDLYLIHYPKPKSSDDDDLEVNRAARIATYATLLKLRDEHKIRNVGVSNYEVKHLEELIEHGLELPFCNQIELHPHFVRTDIKNFCDKNGIAVQAFRSLAKHDKGIFDSPIVTKLAELHKVSKTTIVLSWATSQGVAVIPKSTNESRMRENLDVIQLDENEIAEISKLDCGRNYVKRATGWVVA